MTFNQPTYTAAQIAKALGKNERAVRRQLEAVAPASCQVNIGRPAQAWLFASLPAVLQAALHSAAEKSGVRNAEIHLLKSSDTWQPTIPMIEIAPEVLDRASKLQRALARAIERRNDLSVSSLEIERQGLMDYAREFGHTISARSFRRLMARTLERDGGADNFSRLEIYLPDRPASKKPAVPVLSIATESDFRRIGDVIASFTNPASPSANERSYLWLTAFEEFEARLGDGRQPKKSRRDVLKYLERHAAFLVALEAGSVAEALRRNFSRKYEKWIEEGRDAKAILDARKKNSGHWRQPEFPAEDMDKITAHATLHCGGRVAQAWRELLERGELSQRITSYYLNTPSRKSYVPEAIMERVKFDVAAMEDIHHGPRQNKLNGPHISRDWSVVASLDWYQADDFTLPVYFTAPDGEGWYNLIRGQVLLMIDSRTTCILGYVLISDRNYNSRAIRTLITHVCAEHGLPRKGFYFERGIWESSKLLKGGNEATSLSWGETELGLQEFGIKFVHSNLPRSKPVERVGGAIQNLMEGLPGYVGRNEMVEKFERVQKLMLEVKSRKVDPRDHFMDEETYCAKLEELFRRYNADRQEGKMTEGLCPDEALLKFRNREDPVIKFSAECRYLLAHHKIPVRVTAKGIRFRIGKEDYRYLGRETGKWINHTMLAWFNPEDPQTLAVTDTKRQNAFVVQRSKDIPAMEAPEELIAEEMALINAHQAHTKARYRVLKARYATPARRMMADRDTVELGQEITQQRDSIIQEEKKVGRIEAKGRRLMNDLGIATNPARPIREGQVEALSRLTELLGEESK